MPMPRASLEPLPKNSDSVLATAVWGNVSTNVLLNAAVRLGLGRGLSALLPLGQIVITLLGEIIPQAYFSRNASRTTARFLPLPSLYRVALFPIAKPTATSAPHRWLRDREASAIPANVRSARSVVRSAASSGGDIGRLGSRRRPELLRPR